ncbi:(2Fe-2S) ferredoxin domain-containing protein [Defluviitalea raffinosedens]|uniref:(2Fe-2S) ferredoxin domain-containing protein n=1 Tax=Defluviitalea raffinosedens TaxID=1450156 RepID=A0A7C8HGY1_9FIRM|nr:(2Fe-2S) ferredoxin domain-containing protein [Defluviitalea raffinosedens]KAE9636952.1 (2Fe-2S) ferredoxin domain-containing protein [Defluviitalea raffinosedens]HHW67264.1 (2Fe-2S) ferredoxin domain-containing protein [Candidatus Epulonipiscium sp.]
MAKIKSLDELKQLREQFKSKVDIREKGDNMEKLVQIRVAMATCGIASGAREVMNALVDIVANEKLDNVVISQTGCMGYCYAEPTIEVTIPGEEPVVFGEVTVERAKEIVEKYVKNGELLDGIIPVSHKTVDE